MRAAKRAGSRVVLFPEATLTGYYFPYVADCLLGTCRTRSIMCAPQQRELDLWTIAGTIQKTHDRFLNLAHVIAPSGEIVHEYAKVHMAGRDERRYCRGGNKLPLSGLHAERHVFAGIGTAGRLRREYPENCLIPMDQGTLALELRH